MADRKSILKDIRDCKGNALNMADLQDYLGVSKDTARLFVQGIPGYRIGKNKKYLAIDIARRIEEREAC